MPGSHVPNTYGSSITSMANSGLPYAWGTAKPTTNRLPMPECRCVSTPCTANESYTHSSSPLLLPAAAIATPHTHC